MTNDFNSNVVQHTVAMEEALTRTLYHWRAAQNANIHGEVFQGEGAVLWAKKPVIDWLDTNYGRSTGEDWFFSSATNLCANPWMWSAGETGSEKVWVSDRVYTHLKLVWG